MAKKLKLLLSGASSLLGAKFLELYIDKYDIVSFSKHDPINPIDLLEAEKIKELFYRVKPVVVVHLAATSDRDDPNINETNFIGTKNVLDQAKLLSIPFIFMSSESVYGGNLENEEEILEKREYNPKSDYAKSKVNSEQLVMNSNLPYLILRGHRFIGFVKDYTKNKQFPDTIKAVLNNEIIHLDSNKKFRPSFINHICDVIDFYISNDLNKQRVLNCVVEKDLTYYDLIIDIFKKAGLDVSQIQNDGEEKVWAERSLLSISALKELNYPVCDYEQMLEQIKTRFFKVK